MVLLCFFNNQCKFNLIKAWHYFSKEVAKSNRVYILHSTPESKKWKIAFICCRSRPVISRKHLDRQGMIRPDRNQKEAEIPLREQCLMRKLWNGLLRSCVKHPRQRGIWWSGGRRKYVLLEVFCFTNYSLYCLHISLKNLRGRRRVVIIIPEFRLTQGGWILGKKVWEMHQ